MLKWPLFSVFLPQGRRHEIEICTMALQALSSGLGSVKKAAWGKLSHHRGVTESGCVVLVVWCFWIRNRVAQRESPLEKNLREVDFRPASICKSRSKFETTILGISVIPCTYCMAFHFTTLQKSYKYCWNNIIWRPKLDVYSFPTAALLTFGQPWAAQNRPPPIRTGGCQTPSAIPSANGNFVHRICLVSSHGVYQKSWNLHTSPRSCKTCYPVCPFGVPLVFL